ncbi:hypothetical protein HK101_000553, partial [Irineochytrium annulatum]
MATPASTKKPSGEYESIFMHGPRGSLGGGRGRATGRHPAPSAPMVVRALAPRCGRCPARRRVSDKLDMLWDSVWNYSLGMEDVRLAKYMKDLGNQAYTGGRHAEAVHHYVEALSILDVAPRPRSQIQHVTDRANRGRIAKHLPGAHEEPPSVDPLASVLHSNVAACLMAMGSHDDAAEACREAVYWDPMNGKAHFRLASCLCRDNAYFDRLRAGGGDANAAD